MAVRECAEKGFHLLRTFNGEHGALVRVDILHPLLLLHALDDFCALVGVIGPPLVAVAEHPGRESVQRRGELAAAQLGHGRVAAGADDEDLLLAPFPGA